MKRTLHELAVELHRLTGRGLVHAADDPVVMHQLMDHVTRKHPLRAISDIDLALQFRPLRENQPSHPFGRSHWRGRLDHVQIPLLQQRKHHTGSRLHERYVRLMIPLEGSGYHHEISVAHPRLGVSLEMSGGQHLPQHLLHTRLDDMQFPLVGNLHHLGVDIHAGDIHPVLCGNNSRGQANIAQTHETCFHKNYVLFFK